MTINQATEAARRFIHTYVRTGRQWTIADIEGCMPDGWDLGGVEDSDFHPATLENIASIIYRHARHA